MKEFSCNSIFAIARDLSFVCYSYEYAVNMLFIVNLNKSSVFSGTSISQIEEVVFQDLEWLHQVVDRHLIIMGTTRDTTGEGEITLVEIRFV